MMKINLVVWIIGWVCCGNHQFQCKGFILVDNSFLVQIGRGLCSM